MPFCEKDSVQAILSGGHLKRIATTVEIQATPQKFVYRRTLDVEPEIDMDQKTTQRWLKFGSALTILFGILIAAASTPLGAEPARFLADLIFFPIDGAQHLAASETRLISAIGGGVMAGWGVLLWMISTHLFPSDDALATKLIVSSIVTWFVIDGVGSIVAGAPLNAVFNVSFLLIFCIPLWRYRLYAGRPIVEPME